MPNFCDRIAEAAARFPEHPAVLMSGDAGVVTTSYAELIRLAGNYAAWLHTGAGIRPGDRVAILAANDIHWIAAYLGILRLGAIAVPLDTAYAPEQVAAIVSDAGARVLFASLRLEPVARRATEITPVMVVTLPLSPPADLKVGGSTDHGFTEVRDDDAAAILYTSGTTADPKGVVLTHGNLEAERAAALAVIVLYPTGTPMRERVPMPRSNSDVEAPVSLTGNAGEHPQNEVVKGKSVAASHPVTGLAQDEVRTQKGGELKPVHLTQKQLPGSDVARHRNNAGGMKMSIDPAFDIPRPEHELDEE